MSDAVVSNLITRQKRMEEVRSGFEDAMQMAFDYVNPRRYDLAGTALKGARRRTKMYDGVAQDAFWDWVNGMIGWGVSEVFPWQRAMIADRRFRESDPVQRWLDEYSEQMDWEIRSGNFYDAFPEQLQDGGSGGTAVMFTEESRDLSRSLHRVPHPGSYWISENDEHEVDVYHERVTMTARQALQRFNRPGDVLHHVVRDWANKAESALTECDFLVCICPADDPAIFDRNMTPGRKPWALVTLLYDTHSGSGVNTDTVLDGPPRDRLVRVDGLDYFPPTVWRFRRNSDELYGFSPAMDVLSVIEAAQQHAYNLLNMGNHAARPMMAVPKEARTEFKYLPGSRFGYGSEKRIPLPVQIGGEYPIAVDREEKIHALIYRRYGSDVWNALKVLQQKKERVQATEVLEARSDQMRLLIGQVNNLWRGGVAPTWNNIARIATRARRMPPPPAELQDAFGKDIVQPAFVGPLMLEQIRVSKLSGLRSGLNLLAEVGEILGRHIGPEEAARLYSAVNLPDLGEYICDNSNFPQKLINSDEVRQAINQARAQRAAAEQEAKIARELAAASGQLAKQPGPDSLLAKGAA